MVQPFDKQCQVPYLEAEGDRVDGDDCLSCIILECARQESLREEKARNPIYLKWKDEFFQTAFIKYMLNHNDKKPW